MYCDLFVKQNMKNGNMKNGVTPFIMGRRKNENLLIKGGAP